MELPVRIFDQELQNSINLCWWKWMTALYLKNLMNGETLRNDAMKNSCWQMKDYC